MEYAPRIRFLARAFVDAQGVAPTTAELAELSASLGIPGLASQRALESGSTTPRVVFVSDAGIQLALLRDSFDYTLAPTDAFQVSTDQDFAKFVADAARVLALCVSFFGRIPHRLACVREGFLPDMGEARMQAAAANLLSLGTAYAEPAPFEWDWRCAQRVEMALDEKVEKIHKITSVRRVAGLIETPSGSVPFDRLRVDLDVNTAPTNTRGRFSGDDISRFLSLASAEHDRMGETILKHLGGESAR